MLTYYKAGDRVVSLVHGNGTVVGQDQNPPDTYAKPVLCVVFDGDLKEVIRVSYAALAPQAPWAPANTKDDYKLGDRVNTEYNGAGTVVSYKFNVTGFREAYTPHYLVKLDSNKEIYTISHLSMSRIAKTTTVGTLRVNVELAPDNIAFIDKVAERVAAKVKSQLSIEITQKFAALYKSPAVESRYVTATDKQSIKAALAAGKIVNAPRNSGKTTAILELLRENPGKYVAVYKDFEAEQAARDLYATLYDDRPATFATSNIGKGATVPSLNRKQLYDEIGVFMHSKPLPFAAVFSVLP